MLKTASYVAFSLQPSNRPIITSSWSNSHAINFHLPKFSVTAINFFSFHVNSARLTPKLAPIEPRKQGERDVTIKVDADAAAEIRGGSTLFNGCEPGPDPPDSATGISRRRRRRRPTGGTPQYWEQLRFCLRWPSAVGPWIIRPPSTSLRVRKLFIFGEVYKCPFEYMHA